MYTYRYNLSNREENIDRPDENSFISRKFFHGMKKPVVTCHVLLTYLCTACVCVCALIIWSYLPTGIPQISACICINKSLVVIAPSTNNFDNTKPVSSFMASKMSLV